MLSSKISVKAVTKIRTTNWNYAIREHKNDFRLNFIACIIRTCYNNNLRPEKNLRTTGLKRNLMVLIKSVYLYSFWKECRLIKYVCGEVLHIKFQRNFMRFALLHTRFPTPKADYVFTRLCPDYLRGLWATSYPGLSAFLICCVRWEKAWVRGWPLKHRIAYSSQNHVQALQYSAQAMVC